MRGEIGSEQIMIVITPEGEESIPGGVANPRESPKRCAGRKWHDETSLSSSGLT